MTNEFAFNIESIKKSKGLKVRQNCDVSLFEETLGENYRIKDVFLNLDFSVGSDSILADGFIKGKLGLICARCAEDFEYKFREGFNEIYDSSEKMIDVKNLVRSLLAITVPMKPLCADNCAGIHLKHQTNTNEKICKCEVKKENPFAILKGLKRSCENATSKEKTY